MQKIKLIVALLIVNCLLLIAPKTVSAATIVQIQSLPGYINYTDFKLSCTTDGGTAQFYSKKDGGSYTPFGPSITLSTSTPCQVQVTGAQFGSEGKFWFEVIVDGGPASNINNNETSTTLDTTAPGAPSDFGKARSNGDTTYTITWKNPSDTDFVKVFIYRSTTTGFNADNSNKVAEIGGNPGDTQTWTDNGLDPTKQYYYYARAIDHANNGSGLVGDSSTTTVTSTPKPGTAGAGTTGGAVTQLPKEQATGGSVLGTEASPTASPEVTGAINTNPGLLKWILGHKKISLGVALVLGLLGYGLYTLSKRK